MGSLTAGDFARFFQDVHGCEPFPWQQRLTEQVLDTGWPSVVDLPTGTGKTALLDIAVFALAARPSESPRRIVFVIDRRIVVDQVCKRARQIQERLQEGDTRVLRSVMGSLGELGGGKPLGVAALRGGIPIDREWTHRPDQPWVLVSTVDQFGSRLLFRGYGVGRRMRPVHAGLAGNDCLVILDEVHLSVPFAETLGQVAGLSAGPLPKRFHIVTMSATPGPEDEDTFRLDDHADLEECAELRRRVLARKQATLVSVPNRNGLPAEVLALVRSLSKSGTTSVIHCVGVVVNRVKGARDTHRTLQEAGFRVHLITGRMRPLDRVAELEAIKSAVDPDRREALDKMTIVVATQAIEVGADFSFDALITECASVDSLRQRFGRLDRRGTYSEQIDGPAQAWILGVKSELAGKRPDPIYGESVRATWKELERLDREGPIDIGPQSLAGFPEEAAAPRPQAPLLLNTHMDAWVQTNPQPIVDPPIEWFLHGIQQDRIREVAIVWRRDLTDRALKLVPPRQAEFLSVPIDAAKSWLTGGPETDVADVQGCGLEETEADHIVGHCVRWEGVGEPTEVIDSVAAILPGDTLVVSPNRGGLSSGTWDPSSKAPVEDRGDEAQVVHRRRVTLRLDSDLPTIAKLAGTLPSLGDEVEAERPLQDRVREWLRLNQRTAEPPWLASVLARLLRGFDSTLVGEEAHEPGGYYILTERNRGTRTPVTDPSLMDGSDEAGSMTGAAVTLGRHLEGVAERARRTAERLDLPRDIVDDLWLAGRLHDIGKADRRFQAQLVGGDPVEMAMLKEPFAKSLPEAPKVFRYPRGMRHELGSVALVDSAPEVLAQAHDPELVLHLIATHHGWARPLPSIIEDPDPQLVSYCVDGRCLEAQSDLADGSLALDTADRFWRLVGRYGYYGLAWLETILRLADHRQSAKEDGDR